MQAQPQLRGTEHPRPEGGGQPRRTPSTTQQLNESFKLNPYRYGDQAAHNVDFEFVYRFFYDMAVGTSGESGLLAAAAVSPVPTQEEFLSAAEKEPAKKSQYLRCYFILMLNPQLYDPSQGSLLGKLATLLGGLPEPDKARLAGWLSDVDAERLARMVGGLQKLLSYNIGLLLPGPDFEKVDKAFVTGMIANACRVLEVLCRSNQRKERIPPEEFENRHVNQHFDPKEQYKLTMKGIKILNFMEFPFLLSLDYKNVPAGRCRSCCSWRPTWSSKSACTGACPP